MPNWTDENGNSYYGKLECRRCLNDFAPDKDGEIPVHKCLDMYCKTVTDFRISDMHHEVVEASKKEILEFISKNTKFSFGRSR